jgi:O-antigen ligase
MSLRFLVFGSLFGVAIVAGVFNPFWGLLAYFGHYYLWPEHQWWGVLLAETGVRVSLLISLVTAASVVLHWQELRAKLAGPMIHSQEIILWIYIGVIGLSELWGLPPDRAMNEVAAGLSTKMAKVGILLLILTHVVTTQRELLRLLRFVLLAGGAYLAWEAYTAPDSAYQDRRLEGIGGPDFEDSNFAAAHFVVMGIVAGSLLLMKGRLLPRLGYLLAGGLIANAVVLTQSRGAFLGIAAAGVAALFLANWRTRKYICLLLPLVALGGYRVTDEKFRERMTTIVAEGDERDDSAGNRLLLWRASVDIFKDHPLGVGVGNFYSTVGLYRFELAGRDAHSTFFRCLAELGIPGSVALLALFLNALRVLRWCQRAAAKLPNHGNLVYAAFGLQLALIAFAVCGLTITMTYSEELFVFLLLPVCCYRAVLHAQQESQAAAFPELEIRAEPALA